MYDVIVVGARCAASPLARLLARSGAKVLLVDRATFPSDIPHGHFIHRHGPRAAPGVGPAGSAREGVHPGDRAADGFRRLPACRAREERFYGATDLPNFYRKPYGEGWALVGDAGCHKDPYMALGISDAAAEFRQNLSGARFDPVPAEVFRVREAVRSDPARATRMAKPGSG
jgi:flavin-dependent dehydrogenase